MISVHTIPFIQARYARPGGQQPRRHCRAPPTSSQRAAAAGTELKRWQLWAPRRELPGGWSRARCGLRLRDAAGPERGDRCVGAALPGRVRGFARVRGEPPGPPWSGPGSGRGGHSIAPGTRLQWQHPQGCHLPGSSLPEGGKPRQQGAPRAAGSWDRPLTAAKRGVAEHSAPHSVPGRAMEILAHPVARDSRVGCHAARFPDRWEKQGVAVNQLVQIHTCGVQLGSTCLCLWPTVRFCILPCSAQLSGACGKFSFSFIFFYSPPLSCKKIWLDLK